MNFANRLFKSCFASTVLPIGLLTSILSLPGQSAETVVVSYGLLEFSIPVASLERFADQGHIDSELADYASYFDENQLTQIRQVLTQPIPLSAVETSQLTYSFFGEESLRFVGDIIRTGAWQNGFHSLRGALILSATEPEGLTLLNVIQQFPTSTLRIDAKYTEHILSELTQFSERNDQAMTIIAQLASLEAEGSEIQTTLAPDQLGDLAWRKDVLMLFDESRQRRITADLYQPNAASPVPLIVFSHGLAASRADMIDLAEHLTSHGFAAAVVEHPNSNTQQVQNLLRGLAHEVTEPNEFIDRPLDITYLLDQLQTRNQSGPQQNRLNLQQVGVIGHSFGGYTALALAGANLDLTHLNRVCNQAQFNLQVANVSLLLQCSALQLPETDHLPETNYELQDERIQAAFVFHPIGSALFGEQGLQQVITPVLMVTGSEDWLAPPLLEQICPFTWLAASHKYLALIQGGGHIYAAPTAAQNSLLTELTGPDPATARQYLRSLSLAFFNTHVREQSDDQLLLSAINVQDANQSPLKLHLIDTLSDAQIAQSLNFSCSEVTVLTP